MSGQITLHSSSMYRRRLVGPTVRHCLTYYRLLRKYHDVPRDFARTVIIETLISADRSESTIEQRKEGEWTRLYVPTARIDECIAALDALGSGAGTLDESGAS